MVKYLSYKNSSRRNLSVCTRFARSRVRGQVFLTALYVIIATVKLYISVYRTCHRFRLLLQWEAPARDEYRIKKTGRRYKTEIRASVLGFQLWTDQREERDFEL